MTLLAKKFLGAQSLIAIVLSRSLINCSGEDRLLHAPSSSQGSHCWRTYKLSGGRQLKYQDLSRHPCMTTKSEPTTSPAWAGTALGSKPTWVLPSPFEVYSINCHWDGGETWGPPPKTLLELKMYELSWALRIKPDWQRKAKDPGIRCKWLAEAMEEEFDSYKPDKLSKKMHRLITQQQAGLRLNRNVGNIGPV
ncbi:hypothetical protein K438DRAFT_1762394 [Mycena galopus ATCC 62051]|nr:hypothetical protein K438DRAFT_1762394 [Mycena galopus ATCC 62051]